MAERQTDTGWHAFSPGQPNLPTDLRAMYDATAPHRLLGEVHVLVHELRLGGSEIRVGGELNEVALIDAAITELQEARRLFNAAPHGSGSH